MGKLTTGYQKHKNFILMTLGLVLASMMVLPCMILGEGSYVPIHDQMDGEILNYIYGAKYLFKGNTVLEFMNGMPKASMTMPAPLGVLFYLVLPPFYAYQMMQWMVVLAGFAGMYGLCRYLKIKEEIAFFTGLLFAYMPFYPTYGLAALGQPLLVLSFLLFVEGKRKYSALLGVALYGAFSSLTLVGFAWLGIGVLLFLWFLIKKEWKKSVRTALAWGVLFLTYLIANLNLLGTLFGAGFVSHRQEMLLSPVESVAGRFLSLLLEGGSYSKVYSPGIMAGVLFAWFACFIFAARKKHIVVPEQHESKEIGRVMVLLRGLMLAVYLGILGASLWNSAPIVAIRKTLGGFLLSFQADRIYWIFPFVWMLILACVLQILFQLLKLETGNVFRGILLAAGMLLMLAEALLILRDNPLNKNIRLLLLPGYQQTTWESIYMEDVFWGIDRAIGEDKDKVSVISVGMFPSVPLYNGYTCADGYSNNYELDYKHKFRRIIAAELEKDKAVRKYFDDWGNRLYAATGEYGFDAMLEKSGGYVFRDLQFDTRAMKDLNIGYVFAAAPIENAEELGLDLLEQSPFVSDSSFYAVWVYRVK